jgi:hypothetical protein
MAKSFMAQDPGIRKIYEKISNLMKNKIWT